MGERGVSILTQGLPGLHGSIVASQDEVQRDYARRECTVEQSALRSCTWNELVIASISTIELLQVDCGLERVCIATWC